MSFRNELNYKLKIFVIILLFVITNIFIFYNKKIKYFNGLIILYFILVIVILNGFKQKEKFDILSDVRTAKRNAATSITTKINALQLTDLKLKQFYDKIDSELIEYRRLKKKSTDFLEEAQTNNLEHRILKKLLQIVKFNNYRE